jgi:hypothetical protein
MAEGPASDTAEPANQGIGEFVAELPKFAGLVSFLALVLSAV